MKENKQQKEEIDTELRIIKFNPETKKNDFYYCIMKIYYKKIIFLTILNLCCTLLEYLQIYFYESVIENFEFF